MFSATADTYVLVPGERIDALTCQLLLQEAEDEALANGFVHIVLDGGNLNSISNAGLRALLGLARQLEQNQGQLAVCNLSPAIAALFKQCGLDQFIPTLDAIPGLAMQARAA
jgi:anti-anti-sigma factor